MTIVQVKKLIYLELSSKPNIDILGITLSMWKNMTLKPSSLLMILWIFKMELARGLDLEKYHNIWEWIIIFNIRLTNIPHTTPNYGPGKYKFEVNY